MRRGRTDDESDWVKWVKRSSFPFAELPHNFGQ